MSAYRRVVSRYEVGFPPVAEHQLLQLFTRDTCQDGGIGNLIPVQVKYGKNSAVVNGIKKLIRMPRGRERPGFRLTITDHARDDQTRIVECSPKSMTERVAQFATLVNGSGCSGAM